MPIEPEAQGRPRRLPRNSFSASTPGSISFSTCPFAAHRIQIDQAIERREGRQPALLSGRPAAADWRATAAGCSAGSGPTETDRLELHGRIVSAVGVEETRQRRLRCHLVLVDTHLRQGFRLRSGGRAPKRPACRRPCRPQIRRRFDISRSFRVSFTETFQERTEIWRPAFPLPQGKYHSSEQVQQRTIRYAI